MPADRLSADELRVALVQVRAAYRLLHDYHRRLLDLVAVVRDAFAEQGNFSWFNWGPNRNDRPAMIGKNPTVKWAWDQIPLAESYFHWSTAMPLQPGGLFLGLLHFGDSGLTDASRTSEPDPSTFPPCEECSTQINAWVVMIEEGSFRDYAAVATFLGDEGWDDGPQCKRADGKAVHYASVTVDLFSLVDRNAIETLLIEPLRVRSNHPA